VPWQLLGGNQLGSSGVGLAQSNATGIQDSNTTWLDAMAQHVSKWAKMQLSHKSPFCFVNVSFGDLLVHV